MREMVRIGAEHLARDGAAALSLRAVARDLGVVSSAVYRYVSSRDELLTLLIVDSYDQLGDAVDAAVAEVSDDHPGGQFRAAAHAVRDWALAEPARYGLLFGTPVVGYDAPAEQTSGPGTRVIATLADIWQRGSAQPSTGAAGHSRMPSATLAADLQRIREGFGTTATDDLALRGLYVWPALFGVVSWEVFGQYGDGTFTDPVALFDHSVSLMLESLGIPA